MFSEALKRELDEGLAQALQRSQPRLYVAIQSLVNANEPKKKIKRHIAAQASPLILGACYSTIDHLYRNKQAKI